MKLAYQKPAYKHIALTEAGGTNNCKFTHNYCWETCPIDMGGGFTIFNSNNCNTTAGDQNPMFYVCQYEGIANNNVFGS